MPWKGPKKQPPELEGVGRAVAEQARTLCQQEIAKEMAREHEHMQTEEWISVVREGVYQVVRGFNKEVSVELQMALLDRGDGLVLHAGVQRTLTLLYGNDCVVIESKSEYPRLPMPMSLQIWREPGGDLRFRAVPDSPVFPQEIMTEAQFLSSVLRMACNQDFDRRAQC